jgi:hypothetical protein
MKIIKVDNDRYRIELEGNEVEGSRDWVTEYLTHDEWYEPKEVKYAFDQMDRCNADTASFGVNRTFVVAYKSQSRISIIAHCRAIEELQSNFQDSLLDNPDSLETHDLGMRLASLRVSLDTKLIRVLLGDKIETPNQMPPALSEAM